MKSQTGQTKERGAREGRVTGVRSIAFRRFIFKNLRRDTGDSLVIRRARRQRRGYCIVHGRAQLITNWYQPRQPKVSKSLSPGPDVPTRYPAGSEQHLSSILNGHEGIPNSRLVAISKRLHISLETLLNTGKLTKRKRAGAKRTRAQTSSPA